MRRRIRRNTICGLDTPLGRLSKVDDIKHEVKFHFEDIFKELIPLRPLLEGIHFNQILNVDKVALEAPLYLEEVKEVVWNYAPDKSLGPNSFILNLFKVCWDHVCYDILAFVNAFNSKVRTPKEVSTSFLTVILKLSNPQSIDHYRPICLFISLYILLSKLLSSTLKRVMDNLISKNQCVFLAQRHIQDGVLVVNEILDFANKFKKKGLIMKVDFQILIVFLGYTSTTL